MFEKLWDLAKDNWLKYKSCPTVFLLFGVMYFLLMSSINSWKGITLSKEHYLIIASLFFVAFIFYILCCVIHNRLPKAPKNTLAVLFVIDAESKRLFEDVRYKLVDNFNQSIVNEKSSRFVAICIPLERIKGYQLKDKGYAMNLLVKTNCIFLVTVRYVVDDINSAEDFELSIKYGVRHPQFSPQGQDILLRDMHILGAPVESRRFEKKQTIDVFSFTTQALIYICQYILGFVYLLSNNLDDACELLSHVRKELIIGATQAKGLDTLKHLVDDRLFIAYIRTAYRHMANFSKEKEDHYLQAMTNALTQANSIRSDTCDYHIGMAYSSIILEKDALKAKQHVERGKQLSPNGVWKYNEAFLSAYLGEEPSIIYSKYKSALKIPYPNLIEIVDYIEFVLDREPEKAELHLAAGFIYEAINDAKLMKRHFATFLDRSIRHDERIEKILVSKMKAIDCGEQCNADCSHCSSQNAI